MSSAVFSEIGGRQSADLIVRRIVDAAASGAIEPGEKLPTETEMSEAFSVAPMTLRKGLEVLRDLGVVVTRRGRGGGTFLHNDAPLRIQRNMPELEVSRKQLRDLADLRNAISGQACELAAERAPMEALHEICELSDRYNADGLGRDAMRVIDVQLHSKIANASDSTGIFNAEMRIQEDLSRILASLPDIPLMHEHHGADHGAIVSALLDRDGAAARAAMVAHVEESYEWCIALLAAKAEPGTE